MIECAHCGQENPDRARFCNLCGAPLGADLAPSREVPSREVRKTVTVLFCDVVGSTALAERSDPERRWSSWQPPAGTCFLGRT